MQGRHQKRRVRILVKAFPQPSTKHEETVCCAGVTEDGEQLLRLYPIRYRRAGYARLGVDKLTKLKALGITPEELAASEAAGP